MTAQQRREQLLSVGKELFANRGYEAVTVEEIAAAAEVSKPVVYEHFGAEGRKGQQQGERTEAGQHKADIALQPAAL